MRDAPSREPEDETGDESKYDDFDNSLSEHKFSLQQDNAENRPGSTPDHPFGIVLFHCWLFHLNFYTQPRQSNQTPLPPRWLIVE